MVLGDLIPDAFFFFLGYFGKDSETVRRYRIKFGLHDEHFEKARQLWREHPGKTMFMTKFAYGLSTPFLIMAGLLNMPARIFFSYSIAISMIHYAIMMTLGYLFGESLSSIGSIATAFQIGVAVLAVVMIAYYFGVRYLRSKVEW
jgi:membrane protein DedA with SNARE-associated domain